MNSPNIHIGNFQGILGDVDGSSVSQSLQMTVTPGDLPSLHDTLSNHGVDNADICTLDVAIAADPKPDQRGKFGPQVSKWLGQMLSKAATGAWNVAIDVGTKTLVEALCAYYGLKG